MRWRSVWSLCRQLNWSSRKLQSLVGKRLRTWAKALLPSLFPPLLVPESLFCLFGDPESQQAAGTSLCGLPCQVRKWSTAKNIPETFPIPEPVRTAQCFPVTGLLPGLCSTQPRCKAALITLWVLVDDMRLVCITQLHWGGHPGSHLTGALGAGVRERKPTVLTTSRIWSLPVLSLIPGLWKILAELISLKQKPEKTILFLSDRQVKDQNKFY